MRSYAITNVEGIGPKYAKKLKAISVHTTKTLLERARTPKGRKQLAAESGIEESYILKWANMCDLMRIRGVAEEYSELLEAAGVDTVKELKRRNSANLAAKIIEVNGTRKLVRVVPSEKSIMKWIEQAKTLPPMMKY